MTELRDGQCKGTAWQEATDKEQGGDEKKRDEFVSLFLRDMRFDV